MSPSELRRDPITGQPVLIAPERMARPRALLTREPLPEVETCPFCAGNESATPPELFVIPGDTADSWRCRVVPNLYPAARDHLGAHEIIVESPRHQPLLLDSTWSNVITVIRQRLAFHRRAGRWLCGSWFKNHGLAAGASFAHPHSQLLCLPFLPPSLALQIDAVTAAAAQGRRCPYCRLIEQELQGQVRVVAQTSSLVEIVAVAGRFPYETWILPRQHESHFDETLATMELAGLLSELLRRLDVVADGPAFNLVLHTAPFDGRDFHWHFEVLPRLTGVAGFELGAGMFINPLLPELAAQRLRGY